MPVHKFIHKLPQPPSVPPVAVLWYLAEDVKYPAERDHTLKWKIFAKEDIIVQSHNVAKHWTQIRGLDVIRRDHCLVGATVEDDEIKYSE
jgi:hypothetical protein